MNNIEIIEPRGTSEKFCFIEEIATNYVLIEKLDW